MREKERNDLIISWIVISMAFAFYLSGINLFRIFGNNAGNINNLLYGIPVALVAVGAGFIFHELAHRYTAKKFGAHAEYHAWSGGLVLAISLALFIGFVFAAPGAVYIFGERLTKRQNGLISLSGPATNILTAIGFGVIWIFLAVFASLWLSFPLISMILSYGILINLFLALFNLLPVPPLDGSKIISWNAIVWAIFFVPLAALFVFGMMG